MGGHGGLNILPQKRWNVYNFDNRERVRRDEEAAAREEQAKRQKARQAELEFKLDLLREKNSQSKRRRIEQGAERETSAPALEGGANEGAIVVRESKEEEAERPQHINFFAEFEAKALEEDAQVRGQDRGQGSRRGEERESSSKGRGEGSRKERNAGRGVEKVDGKPTGEPVNENYGLGHGLLDKHGKKPWYTYKSFMVDRTTTEDSERHRPDAKLQISGGSDYKIDKSKKKTGGSDYKTDKSKKKTVEELRSERLKREQWEKDKVRKLLVAQAGNRPGKSSSGYDRLPNGRVPQYHGSFGNAR